MFIENIWLIIFSVFFWVVGVTIAQPKTYATALFSPTDLVLTVPSTKVSNESAIAMCCPFGAIARLFPSFKIQAEWFSAAFLARIPISQIESIITRLKTEFGTYQSIEAQDSEYLITLSRGKISAKIMLDERGKISL